MTWPFASKQVTELKALLIHRLEVSTNSLSLSSQSLDHALEELHAALKKRKNGNDQ